MNVRRSFLADWRDALRDSALDSTAKVVGYTLSTYMNRDGVAFPAKTTIATKASLSRRAVDGAIARLELGGFLIVTHRRDRRGNSYRATIPGTAHEMRGSSSWNCASDDGEVRTSRRGSAQQVPPKAVESRKEKAQRPRIIEKCFRCGRCGPVTDTGVELLCNDCDGAPF